MEMGWTCSNGNQPEKRKEGILKLEVDEKMTSLLWLVKAIQTLGKTGRGGCFKGRPFSPPVGKRWPEM